MMPPVNHSILGASSAERWTHCTPSARLTEKMEDKGSDFAAEGSAAHTLCEWKVRKFLKQQAGRRPSSDYWTDEMEECADNYRDYIADLVGAARQKCRDPVALVEQHLDFSQYVPDGYGTGDFLLIADRDLNIVDYKYGKGVPVYAEHNIQMMLYALGALLEYDMLYDIENVTMTIYQPRLSNISTWEITAEELYRWAEEDLKPKAELAYKGEGDFVPGSWCRFCKAKNTCRARAEYYTELTRLDFKPPALLTDSEMAEVMDKADHLKRWAEDVMSYATNEAVNNGKHYDGWKVVQGSSRRKFTDTAAVEKAAKDAGYTDIYSHSLIPLTQFEQLMGKDDFNKILGKYVIKPAGKLTLARDTDGRREVTDTADDFKD